MTILIIIGYIVRGPLGGMTWHYLQYILGFKKLGYDVYFLEKGMRPNSCYDPEQNIMRNDCAYGLKYIRKIMNFYKMSKNWVFIDYSGKHHGLNKDKTINLLKRADALIDISGTSWLPELKKCRKKIFVDTDPAYTQFRFANRIKKNTSKKNDTFSDGWRDLTMYDYHFTFGSNIGEADCSVPTCGFKWNKTCQPIVLDLWKPLIDPNSKNFTTVMNWDTGSYMYKGERYGPKNIEFQKFITLPTLTNQRFNLAVGGSPPKQLLTKFGWMLVDPIGISSDIWSYQKFIGKSRAEWSVAKNAYVKTRCGWFSERSACYLASAKPVLVQDTGFSKYLPTGRGLIAFDDMEGILRGIEEINSDYLTHCEAARKIAEDHLDSNKVLKKIKNQTNL